jgi:hypothetical protein
MRAHHLILLSWLLAACAAPGGASESPRGQLPSEQPSSPPSPSEPQVSGEVPQQLLDQIERDLATKAAVEVAAIQVIEIKSVTWNDGSLGCPEPGKFYTQALVPGLQVILRVNGSDFDYRASERGDFRLCENPAPSGLRRGAQVRQGDA